MCLGSALLCILLKSNRFRWLLGIQNSVCAGVPVQGAKTGVLRRPCTFPLVDLFSTVRVHPHGVLWLVVDLALAGLLIKLLWCCTTSHSVFLLHCLPWSRLSRGSFKLALIAGIASDSGWKKQNIISSMKVIMCYFEIPPFEPAFSDCNVFLEQFHGYCAIRYTWWEEPLKNILMLNKWDLLSGTCWVQCKGIMPAAGH
jgi:hypothetical protein